MLEWQVGGLALGTAFALGDTFALACGRGLWPLSWPVAKRRLAPGAPNFPQCIQSRGAHLGRFASSSFIRARIGGWRPHSRDLHDITSTSWGRHRHSRGGCHAWPLPLAKNIAVCVEALREVRRQKKREDLAAEPYLN